MNLPTIQIRDIGSGWPFLKDLKDFCEADKNNTLDEILVDLNFGLLD